MFLAWTGPIPLRAAALDAANWVAAKENGFAVTHPSKWVVSGSEPELGCCLNLESAQRALDDAFELKYQCLGGIQ